MQLLMRKDKSARQRSTSFSGLHARPTASATPVPRESKRSCVCGGLCPRCQEEPLPYTINRPVDAFEGEADRVADKVVPVSAPNSGGIARDQPYLPLSRTAFDSVPAPVGSAMPEVVHDVVNSPGTPLDHPTRAFFEPRFGGDLSRVRVHTDDRAAASADAVNARAYTFGNDIAFGAGEYDPHTVPGRRLIAHELTHVVQQAGSGGPRVQRQDKGMSPMSDETMHELLCGRGGEGLFGRTKVGDVFRLWATYRASPPGEMEAMIGPEAESVLHSQWYRVGQALGTEWKITEILDDRAMVVDIQCGTVQTLELNPGTPATPVGPPLDAEATPEHSVKADTVFGSGTVNIYDGCQRVVFVPEDGSPPREYNLEIRKIGAIEQKNYYQVGEQKFHAPEDLALKLKVYLTGDKCGTPM